MIWEDVQSFVAFTMSLTSSLEFFSHYNVSDNGELIVTYKVIHR